MYHLSFLVFLRHVEYRARPSLPDFCAPPRLGLLHSSGIQSASSTTQVLDEIGVSFDEGVPEAPTTGVAQGASGTAETARQPVAAAEAGGPQPPAPPGAGGGDAGMSELEARLNNLRRGT